MRAAWLGWCLAGIAGVVSAQPAAAQPSREAGPLHVPSPDWRDQVIYFAMIDRFDDGDPGNNDQGEGEFDPGDSRRYSGGDLRGLARRLDYIRGLGATAVWVTPPVAHQWWNREAGYGGYHGYWGEDFKRVDPHFGTLDDYRGLSRALHARGMYLVQDIVVNHGANYGGYEGGWSARNPAAHFVLHPTASGRTAPTQSPFDLNDPRRRAHRTAGIYHWTPDIRDYADPVQERDWQMAGLDDLNTDNPRVRDALRDSYAFWIREAGVDAFRVDTAFYVPPAFFEDFLHARDRRHPGILHVARATGREQFHVFGEGFGLDRPYEDSQARKIDRYMRDGSGHARLPGMLNFPLYGTTLDVFSRGHSPAELAHRIASVMRVHARPHLMPSFIDNHDVDRFLASGTVSGLKQALLMLMTLPGIPTIYYGTEQGFTQPRAAMFAIGFGAQARDHFDMDAPLYRYLQQVIALRRGHRVFSRGQPEVLQANAAGPGALAYRMRGEGGDALVVFNTSDRATLVDNLETGLPAGSVLRGVFAIDAAPPPLVVGQGGKVTLHLPARAGYVWAPDALGPEANPPLPSSAKGADVAGAPAGDAITHRLSLDPLPTDPQSTPFTVRGIAHRRRAIHLVVDGDVATAQRVPVMRDGHWQATLPVGGDVDASVVHRVVAWDPADGSTSMGRPFRTAPTWRPLADVTDPAGDDHGPDGRYRYPTDPGWQAAGRVLDLRRVRVAANGGALQLDVQMDTLTAAWNPAHGFDHVALTVYVQLPGQPGGATVMPLQDADVPDGMRWHYRLRVHGWSNVLTSAEGASAGHEGTPVMPSARLTVDRANATVRLALPAAALGHPRTLDGVKVHVTTWDYDAGYRALTPTGGAMHFGGGGSGAPKVMDAATVSSE
ncbi:alpha-amylase family glycosyl hydrolase [Lysobacter olei]